MIFFIFHSYEKLKAVDFIKIDKKFERILSVFDKNPHELIFCWLDKDTLSEYKKSIGEKKYTFIQEKIYDHYIRCVLHFSSRLIEIKKIDEFHEMYYDFQMYIDKYLKTLRKFLYESDVFNDNIEFLNDYVKYIDITTDGFSNYFNKSPAFPICPECLYSFQVRDERNKLIECPTCEGIGWL